MHEPKGIKHGPEWDAELENYRRLSTELDSVHAQNTVNGIKRCHTVKEGHAYTGEFYIDEHGLWFRVVNDVGNEYDTLERPVERIDLTDAHAVSLPREMLTGHELKLRNAIENWLRS